MWQYPEVFVCADDYGYNEGVSSAIIDLLNQKKISGTSVMMNMPKLVQYAPPLKALAGHGVQIGLHFNFTEGVPLTNAVSLTDNGVFKPISEQLISAATGKINSDDVTEEGKAQLQLFIETFEKMPDFIDGHQHIHVVPKFRLSLLSLVDAALKPQDKRPWARVPIDTLSALITRKCTAKSLFVSLLSTGMNSNCMNFNFETNNGFSGFTNFDANSKIDYRVSFLSSLKKCGTRPMIMCHPSKPTHEQDKNSSARVAEYEYFVSDEFLKDLKSSDLTIK